MTAHEPAIAARVRLLVLDCDGVLTDGSITYDDRGHELKTFNVRDGLGLRAWMNAGYHAAIITGRGGPALARRADELGVRHLIEGSSDKRAALEQLAAETGIGLEETAAMGDDWPDLAMFELAGYSIAPADAHADLRARAHFVTPSPGGRGAVRDAVEHLLSARNLLDAARKASHAGSSLRS